MSQFDSLEVYWNLLAASSVFLLLYCDLYSFSGSSVNGIITNGHLLFVMGALIL